LSTLHCYNVRHYEAHLVQRYLGRAAIRVAREHASIGPAMRVHRSDTLHAHIAEELRTHHGWYSTVFESQTAVHRVKGVSAITGTVVSVYNVPLGTQAIEATYCAYLDSTSKVCAVWFPCTGSMVYVWMLTDCLGFTDPTDTTRDWTRTTVSRSTSLLLVALT